MSTSPSCYSFGSSIGVYRAEVYAAQLGTGVGVPVILPSARLTPLINPRPGKKIRERLKLLESRAEPAQQHSSKKEGTKSPQGAMEMEEVPVLESVLGDQERGTLNHSPVHPTSDFIPKYELDTPHYYTPINLKQDFMAGSPISQEIQCSYARHPYYDGNISCQCLRHLLAHQA
ncbi:uncharacterized protein B0I36DRAFT_355037 [Microdochium trichocladiopsis]|uniref:Uncharacterized protein n=1 Tax=Microdochium trichocladiopsis TaxID=1682393 RepID=A0A9P8XV35_9PEZI|nr:uncharacterized protein B0I36DRAFT_355037 [Microdochium trichocladiopsis]KAH7016197.1 hypothetical protein B0I36DRAFT_355037 [Microdochium trichocladiopsis]